MIIHNMQIYNKFKKNMDIYTKKIRNIIQRNISSSLYFFYIQILNNFKLINLYIQNLNSNTRISFLFFSFQQFSIRVWISPFYTEDGRFPSSFVHNTITPKGFGSPLCYDNLLFSFRLLFEIVTRIARRYATNEITLNRTRNLAVKPSSCSAPPFAIFFSTREQVFE